jgi:ubiquilin
MGGGMGGMGGMPFGPGLGPQQIAQMMNNPLVQQSIQQYLQNPQMLQALLANNPLAQQMFAAHPQIAAVLQNPEIYRQMADPQVIQAVMQMFAGGQGGFNPAAAFPNAQQNTAAQGTGSNASAGANQQPNLFAGLNLEPLFNNLVNPQGAQATTASTTTTPAATGTSTTTPATGTTSTGSTGATTGTGTTPATTTGTGTAPATGAQQVPGVVPGVPFFPFGFPMNVQPPVQQDPEQRFALQLQQMSEMGLTNRQLNIQCLLMSNGNVDLAIERMFNG